MIIKNAKINTIIGCERFSGEDKARHTLLLTIESNENINPDDFKELHGKMDIQFYAVKDATCPWQDEGICTKGFYLGEPIRLWWSIRPCRGECP